MKHLRNCVFVFLMLLTALPATAQSILDRHYTSDKLDRFWRMTLGATAPKKIWFELLVSGSNTAEPVKEVANDFGVPFFGEVIGDSASPDGTVRRMAFPVIPMSAEDAAILMRRLAWSELYLNRYRFFESVSTDNAETLQTLAARQYSAGLEAYLISARLYYSAPDLQQKCMRLIRLRELSRGALSGMSKNSPLPDWKKLVAIQNATEQRLEKNPLTTLVCSVKPVRTRGEMVRIVEIRVRERIIKEARTKIDDTLRLLEAASTEFQKLVNDMDVPISSAEIFELERVLGNAQANIILVKEDQLRAAETIGKLRDVDLMSLNQPDSLQEFKNGQERMLAMIKLIDEVLSALADLDQLTDNADIALELAPCGQLRNIYKELDFELDTNTLSRMITEPYEDCIARAESVVLRFQNPSLQKALMAELAAHVRQISEAYLRSVGL